MFIKILGLLFVFLSGFFTAFDLQFTGFLDKDSLSSGRVWFFYDIYLFLVGVFYLFLSETNVKNLCN